MKQVRRIALLAVPLAAAAALVAGCGQSSAPTATGAADVGVSDSPTPTDSASGPVTVDQSGDLPAGWPSVVVLPPGGTITNGLALDQPGAKSWTVTASYDESVTSVAQAFSSSLADAGFKKQTSFTQGDKSLLAFSSDQYDVAVTVGSKGSLTVVAATVIQN